MGRGTDVSSLGGDGRGFCEERWGAVESISATAAGDECFAVIGRWGSVAIGAEDDASDKDGTEACNDSEGSEGHCGRGARSRGRAELDRSEGKAELESLSLTADNGFFGEAAEATRA